MEANPAIGDVPLITLTKEKRRTHLMIENIRKALHG
jgi:hypothetical protein